MKTLPEILHDVMILLADPCVEFVVIARGDHEPLDGHSAAFQIRLRYAVDLLRHRSAYKCEARSWGDGQWATWSERRGWLGAAGFDFHDVLATDWRIIS